MRNPKELISGIDLRTIVEQRLAYFLMSREQMLLREVLAEWQGEGWRLVLFGGVLRDLVIHGGDASPRDIDVVIVNKSFSELKSFLQPYVQRETRFGGLALRIAGLSFDVWPITETWAFRHGPQLRPSIKNLTKTTFLNVEAISAELLSGGTVGRIFEHGFLSALNSGQLDINLSENPFPALAAVRAIVTAKKLNFRLSPRLISYIADVLQSKGIDAIMLAQEAHYADVLIGSQDIMTIIGASRQATKS